MSKYLPPITRPIIVGRLDMGTHPETIVKAPFKMPEPPIPATARPTINIFDDVEIAQIRDPSSKTKKKATKVHYENNPISKEKR